MIGNLLTKWMGKVTNEEESGRRSCDKKSLMGTLSLYEDAVVLTHQSTVLKDQRLHQGP